MSIAAHVGRIAVCTLATVMLMMAVRDPAAAQRGQTPGSASAGWMAA